MLAIGAWSLRRSYRTTLVAVTGAGRAAEPAAAAPTEAAEARREGAAGGTLLVERELPFVGEEGAGIAFATLRSLARAPEAKLLLLSPVIVLGLFGFMLATSPARARMQPFAPLMSLGAVALSLLSIMQLIQNQFGLDRAGFRAFVLSPVPRAQILLGKNLAIAPLGLGLGLIALAVLQLMVPLDAVHLVGAGLQLCSAYLLMCMAGNLVSILGPVRLKENTMKADNARLRTILWQIVLVFLIPLLLSPLAIPYGAELLLRGRGWADALPLYLVLQAAGLLAIALAYRWMLRRQGELLQDREQHILDVLARD
jgi:hypothetical protein